MKKTGLIIPLLLGILTGCVTTSEIKQYDFSFSSIGEGGIAYADYENGIYKDQTLITFSGETTDENGVFEGYYLDDTLLSDQLDYEFVLSQNSKVVAKFKIDDEIENTYYNFDITIDGHGVVNGTTSGNYLEGTEIVLSAVANDGFKFDGYYIDNVLQSSSSDYQFILKSNINLIAKFVSDEQEQTIYQTFSHKFLQNEFNGTGYDALAGTMEVNGLTWTFDAFTFLGQSSDGIQIGSSKQPQKTPWNLSTNFGENVILTSFSFSGKNPNGTQVDVKAGEYTYSELIVNSSYETFTIENLNEEVNDFTISLSAQSKAFYFDTLTITCITSSDSTLQLKTDNDTAEPAVPGQNGVPSTKYAPISKEEYYQDVDLTLTGDVLKNELNSKISKMTGRSYGDAKTMLQYIDENPSKPGYMYGLYDGDDIIPTWDSGATWNREHVWACAQMNLTGTARPTDSTINHSTDLHNLRVACASMNGYHSDKFYDLTNSSNTMYPNVSNDVVSGYHNYSGDHRGDVARILFYMYVRYDRLKLIDDLTIADNLSMGKLSVLLEWNNLDPVDEFEIQRNNRIYEYQGNRNPFIDYPELVQQIF